MVSRAHLSPQPKRHLDRFSRFCRAHYTVTDRQADRPRYWASNSMPSTYVVLRCGLKTIGKTWGSCRKPRSKCISEGRMHIAAWYHGPPPPDQRSRNSGNMCRLARPLTLPNFVALRQKNVRDVLCRKCCFPEKFTLGHQICHQSIGRTRVFSERELTFAFAICYRPSVCLSSVVCLSVTFVRPTQAVQIFGNISTVFGTLAIR